VLPLVDVYTDVMVTYCREDEPIWDSVCVQDGYVVSDPWWCTISTCLMVAPVIIVWLASARTSIEKITASLGFSSSWLGTLLYGVLGLPMMFVLDPVVLVFYPMTPVPGQCGNVQRLRVATQAVFEQPFQALLAMYALIRGYTLGRYQWHHVLGQGRQLGFSIFISGFSFYSTVNELLTQASLLEEPFGVLVYELLSVGGGVKAPLLVQVRSQSMVDYKAEDTLTHSHCSDISKFLKNNVALITLKFKKDQLDVLGLEKILLAVTEANCVVNVYVGELDVLAPVLEFKAADLRMLSSKDEVQSTASSVANIILKARHNCRQRLKLDSINCVGFVPSEELLKTAETLRRIHQLVLNLGECNLLSNELHLEKLALDSLLQEENEEYAPVTKGADGQTYYCGRPIGAADSPSSSLSEPLTLFSRSRGGSVHCGPSKGPQCEFCLRYQNQDVRLTTAIDLKQPMTFRKGGDVTYHCGGTFEDKRCVPNVYQCDRCKRHQAQKRSEVLDDVTSARREVATTNALSNVHCDTPLSSRAVENLMVASPDDLESIKYKGQNLLGRTIELAQEMEDGAKALLTERTKSSQKHELEVVKMLYAPAFTDIQRAIEAGAAKMNFLGSDLLGESLDFNSPELLEGLELDLCDLAENVLRGRAEAKPNKRRAPTLKSVVFARPPSAATLKYGMSIAAGAAINERSQKLTMTFEGNDLVSKHLVLTPELKDAVDEILRERANLDLDDVNGTFLDRPERSNLDEFPLESVESSGRLPTKMCVGIAMRRCLPLKYKKCNLIAAELKLDFRGEVTRSILQELATADFADILPLNVLSIGADCKLAPEDADHMTKFRKLTKLCIGASNWASSDIAHNATTRLKDLPELTTLEICGNNNLSATGVEQMKDMPKLKDLTIGSQNCIGDSGILHLAKCTQLTSLTIHAHNDLGDRCFEHLKPLSLTLKQLTIGDENQLHIGDENPLSPTISGTLMTQFSQRLSVFDPLSEFKKLTSLKIGNGNGCGEHAMKQISRLPLDELAIGGDNGIGLGAMKYLQKIGTLKKLAIGKINDVKESCALLAQLTSIEELSIGDYNHINVAGASALTKLTKLRTLTIGRHNKINAAGAQELSQLGDLEDLTIGANNDIGEQGVQHFSKLHKLTSLTIGGENQIFKKGCEYLSNLKQLKNLTIGEFNGIQQGMEYLSSLKQLTTLEIGSNNDIGSAGVQHLKDLKLKQLIIGGRNKLGVKGAEFLKYIGTLTHLTIGFKNEIGSEGFQHISSLQRLESLDIGVENEMGPEGAQHLKALKQLTSLTIGEFNNLGEEGAEHILAMTQLCKLKIDYGNRIGEDMYERLVQMPNLTYFVIKHL